MNTKNKNEKIYKRLKIAIIILASLLVVELVYFGIRMYQNRKNTSYYSIVNNIIKDDAIYVGAGFSDFKNSEFIEYDKEGYIKPVIFVYDENKELINEIAVEDGYDGTYNDIIAVKDGYIAVGEQAVTETMYKDGLTEGLIVKYDKEFNIVWKKNLQILDDTTLMSVAIDKDNSIVAVGQSIYASDIIGNHTTGGAIIVRYTQDGEKKQVINYGGPKSGIFNDIEIVDDGYVVVGMIQSGTGVIFKYDRKGNEKWHNYYGYTDSKGLSSITKVNDGFVVTGSKLEGKDKTDNYDGVIIKFNNKGKLVKDVLYEKSDIARLENAMYVDDKIIALASYGVKENDILINDAAILEYDKNLELVKEEVYEVDNTMSFVDIMLNNDNYLVMGYTDTKLKEYGTNGYDYFPVIVEYNKELKLK